jgi:hypothetical protein
MKGKVSTSCRASGPPVTSNQTVPNSHPRKHELQLPFAGQFMHVNTRALDVAKLAL